MNYHRNAALAAKQRQLVRHLAAQGVSVSELARRFGVHRRTIGRWKDRDKPTDRSSAPHNHGRLVVTDEYREAVVRYRNEHPSHGPKRIALELQPRFPTANVATVWRILHAAGLSQPAAKKTPSAAD